MKKLLSILMMGAILMSACSGTSTDITWVIDEGMRLDNASNPRIMSYEEGVIELAYELHATELLNHPSNKAYITTSEDGLNFEEGEQQMGNNYRGDGVMFSDGTQRRYFEDVETGTVLSESSTDGGETWLEDEGYRYDLNVIDEGWMGVRTYWVDEEGGVTLVYNTNTIDQPTGGSAVLVRLAYSEPGDMGMNFELVNENLIAETDETGMYEMVADPVAIVLDDGRVRLAFMRQGIYDARPPKGKTGEILTYISEDGVNFEFESTVVKWSDFEEWDVHSLNDPKIMELDDGRFRVYVAAQIPDPDEEPGEIEKEDGTKFFAGYKWILVSVTTE